MANSEKNDSVVNGLLQKFSLVDILVMYGRYDGDAHQSRRMVKNPWNLDENTPSFEINRASDGSELWSCWGAVPEDVQCRLASIQGGRQRHVVGGGLLDLVCALGGFNSRKEAVDHLLSESGQKFCTRAKSPVSDNKVRASSIVVEQTLPEIRRSALIRYAKGRGISPKLLSRYCRQVRLHFSKKPDRQHFYISFPNGKGGTTLRNDEAKVGKLSTSPSAPTFITSDGRFSASPSSKRVVVFEGFFNFLSYLEYYGKDIPGSYDVCVLNSVTNLHQALPKLMRYDLVGLCLDNDKAGYAAAKDVREAAAAKGGVAIRDLSAEIYPSFNDMNDFLRSKVPSLQAAVQHQGSRV